MQPISGLVNISQGLSIFERNIDFNPFTIWEKGDITIGRHFSSNSKKNMEKNSEIWISNQKLQEMNFTSSKNATSYFSKKIRQLFSSINVSSLGQSSSTHWVPPNIIRWKFRRNEDEELDGQILFRKESEINKTIRSATAFICGLGYYELTINGKKVGDHLLDPGFTNYSKEVLYTTYDVTPDLKIGNNCIGLILGGGWYDPGTPDVWGFHLAPWVAPPKLVFNLNIEYSDGTKSVIASDMTWKVSTGPIIFNSIRGGENYDARHRWH